MQNGELRIRNGRIVFYILDSPPAQPGSSTFDISMRARVGTMTALPARMKDQELKGSRVRNV